MEKGCDFVDERIYHQADTAERRHCESRKVMSFLMET